MNDADSPQFDPRLASAWPRRFKAPHARLIAPEELRSWILHEDERLLVINKPGDVVCHPSKAGPWSSLVGAAREHLGQMFHLRLTPARVGFRIGMQIWRVQEEQRLRGIVELNAALPVQTFHHHAVEPRAQAHQPLHDPLPVQPNATARF